jgi:hypothetical protein
MFDERYGSTVESFFAHGDRFTDTIWITRLQSLAKPGGKNISQKYKQQVLVLTMSNN